MDKSLPDTLESVQANKELADKFDMTSMEMLLINKDIPDAKLNDMLEKIDNIDGIAWTLSYSKITKGTIPLEMMPDKIKDMLVSDKYQLVLINSEYEMATDELNEQIGKVNEIVKATDENAILAGEGPLMKDLVEVANHDFNSRMSGINKKDAIDKALGSSIQSIIVSGLSFFAATIGVAIYSKIELIGSLCTLMARGAIISMLVVMFIVPSVLLVFDKLIIKTTLGFKKGKRI